MKEARVEVVLFVVAALCALGARALARPEVAPSLGAPLADGMRIVVWNVGGTGAAARSAEGSALQADHVAAVADALRGLDFDLACLVELQDAAQARALAQLIAADVRVLTSPGDRPLALLSRRGRLSGTRALPRGGGKRPTLVARVHSDRLGRDVVVGALHASPWSATERNAHLGGLVDALARTADDAPRLALGDFNLEVQTEGRQDLFTDDAHLDLETYGYVTRALVDCGRAAGATVTPDRRLDYVLASEALVVANVVVVRGRRRGDMDHDPLVIDVRLARSR